MAEVKRQRHIVGGLVAGISEHHALVACALILRIGALHAAVDVGALFMKGRQHATGFGLEFQFAAVVAYIFDHLTGHLLKINVCVALHLPGYGHMAGGHKSLAGNLGVGIVGEKFVEDGVADLVGNFIGVSFRHRFRCKEIVFLICHSLFQFLVCQWRGHKKWPCLSDNAKTKNSFCGVAPRVTVCGFSIFLKVVASSQICPLFILCCKVTQNSPPLQIFVLDHYSICCSSLIGRKVLCDGKTKGRHPWRTEPAFAVRGKLELMLGLSSG